MISVTEEAKELFLDVERPEGTVLRLDPVTDESSGETQIGLGAGEQRDDDQVVEHAGRRGTVHRSPGKRSARRQHPRPGGDPRRTGDRYRPSRAGRVLEK